MQIESIHAQMYIQPTYSLHTSKLLCLCSCPQTQLVCLFSSLEETEKRVLPIRHRQIKESLTSLGECYTPALHLSKDQKHKAAALAAGRLPSSRLVAAPVGTLLSLLTPDGHASALLGVSHGITLKLSKETAFHTRFTEAILLSQSTQRHTALRTKRGGA